MFRQIIKAIRKLIGFGNVSGTETDKTRLESVVRDGFRTGSATPVSTVREAFFSLVKLSGAEKPEEPARPGSDNLEIVKTVVDGYEHDPDGETLTIHVKNTGHYVNLYLKRVKLGDWKYDFASMRLASAEGKEIRGKKGDVPEGTRSFLEGYYGHAKLDAAPVQRLG